MKQYILISILILIAIILTACSGTRQQTGLDTKNTMETFNTDNYEAAWKTIDSLEREGLPKSALEKTELLLAKARKENNAPQLVKAVIYQNKYKSQLEEDGYVKAIYRMEQEIENAAFPAKPILQSMMGEMYNNYLQQNSWQLQNRTQTLEFKTDDVQTWTVQQLNEKAIELYKASVQDKRTQQVAIEAFKDILKEGKETENLRPTIYDVLAHRAIDFFANERTYLTQPAYKFYINQAEAFSPVDNFVNYKFDTQDVNSHKLQNLLLTQELLKFHLKDKTPEALIDADLKRLKFVHQNAVMGDKEDLYLKALEALQTKYKDHPAYAQISHYIAEIYFSKGNKYQADGDGDGTYQFDLKKAHEICKTASERFPNSYGAASCRNLIRNIETDELRLMTEKVNIRNKPFLVKVDYKNVKKIYLKTVEVSEEDAKKLGRMNGNEIVKFFNKKTATQEQSVNLPDDGDFQSHSTEIRIKAKKSGRYVVLAAENDDFNPDACKVAYAYTYVSDIAFLDRSENDYSYTFYMLDRVTGEPLKNVKAEFFKYQYNSRKREYETIPAGTEQSDAKGLIKVNSDGGRDRLSAKFTYKDDVLFLNDTYYMRGSSEGRSYTSTTFFTDRAIYRPGQTIYFKALVMNYDSDRMPTIKPNVPITITFKDVNYQDVETLKLRTNEYGTVSGSFTAPMAGLLGRMTITSSEGNGRHSIRVEEYKRPKFEVSFEPVKGSFKLDDKVKVSGQAKAYAGSNVDGAEVSYRVVREVRFPYWRWWDWGWRIPWSSESMEITNGTTKTDETGKFEIEFTALPDRSIPLDRKPEFSYKVIADVTDITGETHSQTTYVKVGAIALSANISVPEQINRDSMKTLAISTKNLNGEFEPAKGTIKIEKLITPDINYLTRRWSTPDKPTISEAEFKRDFPLFAYKDEDKKENWAVTRAVFTEDFDTEKSKEYDLSKMGGRTALGWHRLTFKTQDKYGEKIEVIKHFLLYDLDERTVPDNSTYWHVNEKTNLEPGEQAKMYFGSAEPPVHVLYELEEDKKTAKTEWIKTSDLANRSVNIQEKHRGNIYYKLSMVRNNRAYVNSYTLVVPWSNKDLTVEYATFRDKLLPGQDEEWQIKISGHKGDKVAAEMLASMYDASLDAFVGHSWNLPGYPTRRAYRNTLTERNNFSSTSSTRTYIEQDNGRESEKNRIYPNLRWFNFNGNLGRFGFYSEPLMMEAESMEMEISAPRPKGRKLSKSAPAMAGATMDVTADSAVPPPPPPPPPASPGGGNDDNGEEQGGEETDFSDVKVRANLNETVFFFPDLQTDAEGNIIIKFKMNEALTRWKFMGAAHTKDYQYAYTQKEIVTQKDLMVLPNPPRFFRERDEIYFAAKVSNLSEKDLSGSAQLLLFDALTMEPLDVQFGNRDYSKQFTAPKGQSAPLSWKLKVPENVSAVTWRIVAKAGNFSDGEESSLPVLTNRMMVTETMPLPVRGNETKSFTFKAMEKASQSNTLSHHKMTLEFTSNPAWYAVQALPYLMEYPYDCTEQIFSRYYANSLASSVANLHPKVKRVFEAWKGTDALESNLSKNQELKTALLEETPWVLNAQSEAQQKKRIGLLFDLNKMAQEEEIALRKISERQLSNGGFSWFPGGRDSWYITQYLVEGMGHLNKLGVKSLQNDQKAAQMMNRAVKYTDDRIAEKYTELQKWIKKNNGKMSDDHLDNMAIHYLYARTFFNEIPVNGKAKEAFDYYMGQADEYWLKKGIYMQGMLALALQRNNKTETPAKIVKSLKERSLNNEELGMYWKYNTGYYWYQLPIETHAMMIEVFRDVADDDQAVDDLKVWMLKNKQTTHWKTTKATASAVYALLMSGQNWLLEDDPVQVKVGNKTIDQSKLDVEAGTGYFKTSWTDVENNMSKVEVQNPNDVVAWGAMYWQYFEDLDKIETFEDTPLTLKKELFREENTDTGPAIRPISAGATLKPGDKLKVRIELRVDRDMEYVHMKDMRASGFEPMNVLSQYKWQGGLGYYESTRDASTNFFIDYLRKGTYVFEYPLRVNHKGNFSNGITTIQCMYAPEFTSHSEGIRVKVE